MLDWLNHTILKVVIAAFMPVMEFLTKGGSRYFWMYCVSGLLIAAYARYKHTEAQSFQDAILDKRVWLSPSALNDYLIVVIWPVLRITILSALALNWQPVSAFVVSALHSAGVSGEINDAYANALGIALTLTLFIADDFARWFAHFMFHRIPELWEFHKVHHSAEVLNFITADRLHPVERLTDAALTALVYGTINGLFIAAFGDKLTVTTVMGANAFLFAFNICGGVLRHSPFWISFGPTVEKWVISPAMHQIHHSNKPEHYDRNYGGSLAVWDRMFGSLHIPRGREIESYGIGEETADFRSFAVLMFRPFTASAAIFQNRFKGAKPDATRTPETVSA
jgi:sterol desaturase/sphingolipid hydroxylase (fatty acid hydroxylase superfamily)